MDTLKQHQIDFILPAKLKPSIASWIKNVKQFITREALEGTPRETMENVEFQLEDVLESLTTQLTVQLVSKLGHYSSSVRTKAATFLFQLACTLDEKQPLQKSFDIILTGLQVNEYDTYERTHELFALLGKSFSKMVLALISGLESFYTCSDWHTRGICNSALGRLVYENEKIFLEEDHLAAIWNLYFLLGSIPQLFQTFPDRIVIIKNLGLLSSIYTNADPGLTRNIVECLLKLKNKSSKETEEIKKTLQSIFKLIHPATLEKSQGLNYSTFLNLISPNDENAYDLLPWAFEKFTQSIIPDTVAGAVYEKKVIPPNFAPLNQYLLALSNHFRSSSTLVRYGACIFLHTALSMSSQLLLESKYLYIFIASGLLDTDYLTFFLYLSMVESLSFPEASDVKAMVSKYRQSYLTSHSTSLYNVLESLVELSPPMATKLLQKMAGSLEYLSKPLKLKQLELIRIWGSKTDKFDLYLMQTLVPLCADPDTDIQSSTISTIQSFVKGLKTSPPNEVSFVWSYISLLLNSKTQHKLLILVLNLSILYPIDLLKKESREKFLDNLFKLTFHTNADIRLLVYKILGDCISIWVASGLSETVTSILLLSLGEQDPTCLDLILHYLIGSVGESLSPVMPFLMKLKSNSKQAPHIFIRDLDNLATGIMKSRVELKSVLDILLQPEYVDAYWNFYATDTPENQLIRPDDYNYNHLFVHAPFWIALLLTKLHVPPPPISTDPSVKRDVIPTTAIGKRRFICGYLLTLFPATGMPDDSLRRIASVCLVMCCFKETTLQQTMLKSLFEFITKQFIISKYSGYQISALNVMTTLIRLKLLHVSSSVFTSFLSQVLEILFNTPLFLVKAACLEFIKVSLFVFPKGCSDKLEEIRDLTRSLLVEKDPLVYIPALELYPLIFKCTQRHQAKSFQNYLNTELSLISSPESPTFQSDPLLSKLNPEELSRVKQISIYSFGLIDDPSFAFQNCQSLTKHLCHSDPQIRSAALSSIIALIPILDTAQSLAIIWILLPFYADMNKQVRLVFIRFLKNIPSKFDGLATFIEPSSEDAHQLPTLLLDDALVDTETIQVFKKYMDESVIPLEELSKSFELLDLPPEDDGFHLPTVSEKLMKRFKILSQAMTGPVPDEHTSEIIFYLQEIQKTEMNQANAMLVLSQFCCVHEATFNDIVDFFVNNVSQDIIPENSQMIEACILGLRNVCQNSPASFKQIVNKVTLPSDVNEVDLLLLLSLQDMIKEGYNSKITDLITKYTAVLTSPRHTLKKRLLAIYLTVDLAIMSESKENLTLVLDALQSFIQTMKEGDVSTEVYLCFQKLLNAFDPKDPLVALHSKNLVTIARLQVESKDPKKRLKSLYLFPLYSKFLTVNEAMWFVLLYLADSDVEVREKSKILLAEEGIFDGILDKLESAASKNTQSRLFDQLQIVSTQLNAQSQLIPKVGGQTFKLSFLDPYNSKYYNSELFKKFVGFYGLSESFYLKSISAPTQSILESIKEKYSPDPEYKIKNPKKVNWISKVSNVDILQALIPKNGPTMIELSVAMFELIENAIKKEGKDEEDEEEDFMDLENLSHRIRVLSVLVFASDGLGAVYYPFIQRLQDLIIFCNQEAHSIREGLFYDLEKSLFFFNEVVDIPIVSDEQFETVESLKKAAQEAALEIVKAGKADKLSALEIKKNEMNKTVDDKSEFLNAYTTVALYGLSGFGAYTTLATCEESKLIDFFQFLVTCLDHEHRGMRVIAVEAIVSMVQVQLKALPNKPLFIESIKKTIQELIMKLSKENSILYRKKSDYMELVTQLSLALKDSSICQTIVQTLVHSWRDIDSQVRKTCIKMVQLIGESGMYMAVLNSNTDIMQEISTLLTDPEFPEKNSLLEFLDWRYSSSDNNNNNQTL